MLRHFMFSTRVKAGCCIGPPVSRQLLRPEGRVLKSGTLHKFSVLRHFLFSNRWMLGRATHCFSSDSLSMRPGAGKNRSDLQ